MANPQEAVRVEIFDQDYRVKGTLDPEYLEVLAKYVDGKMRSIAARSHNVDTVRVAVLAALNIADEYHQLKSKYDAIAQQVEQKVGECSDVLDQFLDRAV
ncbi:MAG: cell division protein ZapA [Acidobacteria bacterium]|nr:cell division protein ZapA [Acidobacteriota bacterium]